jgi:polar amino acid transport system substrate-binding protein
MVKKCFRNTVVCVAFVIWLSLGITFQGSAQDRNIRISSGEYAPWTSEFLPNGGFVNHVITEAFQREGYTVSFAYYPWKRAFETAKNGICQATSFWADDEDYLRDFYRSEPIMQAKVVFFHLRSNHMHPWTALTDLRQYRIGTMLGETSTKMLEDAGLKTDSSSDAEQNFKKILAGRIEVFPLDVVTGLEVLGSKFPKEQAALIAYDSKPLFRTDGFLLFSRQNKDGETLVIIFNKGLAALQKEGRYEQLYQDLLTGKYKKQALK